MDGHFSLLGWSGFAAGLEAEQDWLAWARQPTLPVGAATPVLAEMPAMQRRRLEPLGRMALQVAWRCQTETEPGLPMVFASRHGDVARTYDMLAGQARGEPLSPTHFGLSTHNAIAAQYSIARGLTDNYLAISAGLESPEAAVTEALALLADGAPEVLVVVYDGPTPEPYGEYRDEPEAAWAWAWRIGSPRPGSPQLSLQPHAGGEFRASALPHGLDVLRFALAGEGELVSPSGTRCWRRHG
ncbi:beta-ketoacyl synthase chain length factor [Arenimonas alkanexedens]